MHEEMSMNTTKPRSIRVDIRTHKHFSAAAKYFDCSVGGLLELLLDATSISAIHKNTKLTQAVIDNFYEIINTNTEKDNFLFKD